MVLSPTRELALQTFRFAKELGKATGLRHALLVGGDKMEAQFEALASNPDVLIATPGRLLHHLSEVQGMNLKAVEMLVFDEADRLFELGFAEQLRQILQGCSETRQTLLFSATMPVAVAEFAKAGLREPQLIRLDTESKVSPDLALQFFTVSKEDKPAALLHLLAHLAPDGPTIVFASTKHHVEFLSSILEKEEIPAAAVYGAMDQVARQIAIARFRNGKARVLLVTDLAARGLDIPLLDHVVNYDFPPKPKLFVHRVGRAARNGRVGTAYSLMARDEIPFAFDLHLFLGRPLRPAPAVLPAGEADGEDWEDVYGAFPQGLIDAVLERVRKWVAADATVGSQQATMERSHRLYLRTRPGASVESCSRLKDLPREGPHPKLASLVAPRREAAVALTEFTEKLKTFRPAQTVLEAEIGQGKQGVAGVSVKKDGLAAALLLAEQKNHVMQRKRQAHDKIIRAAAKRRTDDAVVEAKQEALLEEAHQAKLKAMAFKSTVNQFKDEDFYIPSVPSSRHTDSGYAISGKVGSSVAFDDAIMDIAPDDENGRKQRANYHWDKKKRRYIKMQPGEELNAKGKRSVKNEAGKKVKAANQGHLYKRWKQSTNMEIPASGQLESADAGRRPLPRARAKGAGAAAAQDLKNPDQVRKARGIKDRERSYLAAKKRGAGRGGGGGGKQKGGKFSGRKISKGKGKAPLNKRGEKGKRAY